MYIWLFKFFCHLKWYVLYITGQRSYVSFTQQFTDPESPGSFRFRKRIERLRDRRFEVCDNTLLGICVSRRNAVSAGKGGKALRLIED